MGGGVGVGAGGAACSTATVSPAIVTVPERAGPVFTLAVIVAEAGPFAPPDTTSHDARLNDVHEHPLRVPT